MRAARAIASAFGALAVLTSNGQAQAAVSNTHHGLPEREVFSTSDSAGVAGVQFVAQARVAANRFRSLDSAIADGYRRLGMDFPAMGEHWVNRSAVLAGKLD